MNLIKHTAYFKFAASIVFLIGMFWATYDTSSSYTGNHFVLYIFTFIFYLFLCRGLFFSNFYFQTFLSIFLSIGIWLKLVYRVQIKGIHFLDALGNFDFSSQAYDKVLYFSISGILGFVFSEIFWSTISKNFRFRPHLLSKDFKNKYNKYYFAIIILLIIFIFSFNLININFKIYQRGTISSTTSFLLRGIYAWGLLFGLNAIATSIVNFDLKLNKNLLLSISILFFESLMSSISMLSRGFILNAGTTLFVVFKNFFSNGQVKIKELILILFLFVVFLFSSNKIVSATRSLDFNDLKSDYTVSNVTAKIAAEKPLQSFQSLFIDRWVGLEGIMAGTSYKGDRLLAFSNIYNENMGPGSSFYDKTVALTIHGKNALEGKIDDKHQFISIPGTIGWISILDNLWLTFIATFLIGLFCLFIETICIFFHDNMFLTALIGQVLAYRIVHFGYLPKQSYLLISTVLATIIGFAIIENYLLKIKQKDS